MKKFNDFNSAFDWIKDIVAQTKESATPSIAVKVYEDSKKYTYIDTEIMYKTGNDSDFENGYVLIKGPQVRWLYYTQWIKAHKNPNAIPQWFERTKKENINNYKILYGEIFTKVLKRRL